MAASVWIGYFNSGSPITLPVSLADGGTGASLSDPGADRILFWDDSAGAVDWLTVGSGMSISGTTISATGTTYTGTANQVIVTGTVLSTPQDIGTASSVTFGQGTFSNLTSGRVAIVGASGLLTDDAGITANAGGNWIGASGGFFELTGQTGWSGTTSVLSFFRANNSYADMTNTAFWPVAALTNTLDLGGASNQWKTGYFGTSVFAPTLYGSSAANGDLILEGTSSATKTTSDIALQPNGGTLSTGGTACVASYGPAAVASITVKNGLIVAIS